MNPREASTALGHTPPSGSTINRVVRMHYRGNYTSYERDVRLALAVSDKYWP